MHWDSLHIRKTSICASALSCDSTLGYGGSPAPGCSLVFSMQRSIVTESPRLIAFGLQGTKPGQTVGRNEALAEQTDMLPAQPPRG